MKLLAKRKEDRASLHEARGLCDRLLPDFSRVLGPEHCLTYDLKRMRKVVLARAAISRGRSSRRDWLPTL